MTARRNPEQAIQKAVAQHLRQRGKAGLVYFHVPNGARLGGRRGAQVQGALMKAMGVRAGVSDFILLHDGKFFALELKADHGRLSPEQIQFLQDVNAAGGYAAAAQGLDRALDCLEMWGCLEGKAA